MITECWIYNLAYLVSKKARVNIFMISMPNMII